MILVLDCYYNDNEDLISLGATFELNASKPTNIYFSKLERKDAYSLRHKSKYHGLKQILHMVQMAELK